MASSSAAPSLLAALLTDLPPPEAGAAAWPEERWRQVLEEDARTCACVRRMRSRARNTGVMVPTSIGLG